MKMRFWALSLCAGLLASTSVGAACNGGRTFATDGITFCMSNVTMNWWSAFNWCQANGQVLAHIATACPGIQAWPNANAGACSWTWHSTNGVNAFAWTSMAHEGEQAIAVEKYTSGSTNSSAPDRGKIVAYSRATKLRALCVASN